MASTGGIGSEHRGGDLVGLDRFTAFSDGVYAIAITLLVLELPVLQAETGLLAALAEEWPGFLGYVISFAFIGGSWMTHARMTRLMRRADGTAAGLNLLVLLFIAVLPFTTKLMVVNLSGAAVGEAVLVYGLNVLVASIALSVLLLYLGRERSLLVDDTVDDVLAALIRARWIAIGVTVLALAATFVAPLAAVTLYLAVTLLVLVLPVISLRRRG